MSRVTIVVGGGAIGLLTAYQLAKSGLNVLLLETGQTGQEASWAGGGIISPLYPWRYSPAITALAHWSQDFYPSFGQQLLAESGIDPEVQATGLYWLDLDDEAEALAWAKTLNRPLNAIPMAEVQLAVPPLSKDFKHAIFMPGVANVRNPRLLQSLKAALLKLPNVQIQEQCPVTGFVREGERVLGVQTPQGPIMAERVVVAAGAWSGQLLATLGLDLPVKPMKGQMILFKCASNFLPAMVMTKERYAIPRRDGHILVGSTLEDVGFDKTPTAEAQASLRASAMELLPDLAQAEIVKHWAGLRPGSPEGIPYIGPVPQHEGLWLNCGHFRNGLVLAPASCRLLVELIQGMPTTLDPKPYAPLGRLGVCCG